ncbi:peptidoglycan-binding protein [Streptomyces sp. NPDC047706]|uniref:peptidoglycan-binding domain-containing protein n=1 Tax=Streptomyces sp. NPDC047706 TaxID=3365486 RepID=UPI0037151E98
MANPNEHRCPECGTPRAADNTPSCACGERAAEALRDARTAEQAAAEDFDPLRIRPYVSLSAPVEPPPASAESAEFAELPEPGDPHEPPGGPEAPGGLHAPGEPPTPEATAEPDSHPRPGRRRTTLLAAAAILTVAATAGFAGGLFSYDPPARDSAAPEPVREAVPQARTSAPVPAPSTAATSAAPTPRSPSPTPSATPTPSPTLSTSPSAPPPSPTATRSSAPTAPATNSQAPADSDEPPPTLRRGDSGPEVTELQLRLRQLDLYNDDPHGHYTREVEYAVRNYQWARGVRTDELGVYGEETRQKLESETSEP